MTAVTAGSPAVVEDRSVLPAGMHGGIAMSTAVDYDARERHDGHPRRAPADRGSRQRRWRHVTPPPSADPEPARDRRTPSSSTAPSAATPVLRVRDDPASGDVGRDPAPLLVNLTRCVVEILAGVRSLDQLARWVTDDVYAHLVRRVTIAARSRAMNGSTAKRPRLVVGEPIVTRPYSGVVEAVVLVHQPARTRAVAIRLDDFGGRWRASAITVL